MQTVEGIVEQIGQRVVNTSRGESTAYSVKIGKDWLSAGFKKPAINKGQAVKAIYSTDAKGYKKLESFEVIASTQKVITPEATPTTTTDWDAKDKRIALMSCRNSALQLAEIANAAGALPLPTKKEDKLEALEAFVAMTTQVFFKQLYTKDFGFTQELQDTAGVTEVEAQDGFE